MLENSWFKKEKPLLGLTGMGGGASGHLVGGGPGYTEATGGTTTNVTINGVAYKIHTFDVSGAFQVITAGVGADNTRFDWIVVAGGGGGGSDSLGNASGNGRSGGGGGAGGLRTSLPEGPGGPSPTAETYATISAAGTYPVVVGGGAGASGKGSDSVFNIPAVSTPASTPTGITATGGGYGATPPTAGGPGGSGGGGGGTASGTWPGGSAAAGQGYDGGTGYGYPPSNSGSGGGGGGAGGAGTDGPNGGSGGGVGGVGKAFPTTIPGHPRASSGFSGGGTAGRQGNANPIGGGGAGPDRNPGTAGAANSGGGGGAGGGGGPYPYTVTGGTGGSGTVIIRYRSAI